MNRNRVLPPLRFTRGNAQYPSAYDLDTSNLYLGSDVDAPGPEKGPESADSSSSPVSAPWTPIPSAYIVHACVLILGLTRAFPSAHQSLHLSVYYFHMGYINVEAMWVRFAGGLMAAVAAILYYHFWYVYIGRKDGVLPKLNKRLDLMGLPAYMASQAELRLPDYMRIDPEVERYMGQPYDD